MRVKINNNKNNFNLNRLGVILESVPIAVSCFVTETKSQMFCKFPGFHSTSGYMSIIFSAHLVTMKREVFTTTSTREIQLCARPATQLTCSPLLLANHACQSIVHARRFKRKGFIILCFCLTQGSIFFFFLSFFLKAELQINRHALRVCDPRTDMHSEFVIQELNTILWLREERLTNKHNSVFQPMIILIWRPDGAKRKHTLCI